MWLAAVVVAESTTARVVRGAHTHGSARRSLFVKSSDIDPGISLPSLPSQGYLTPRAHIGTHAADLSHGEAAGSAPRGTCPVQATKPCAAVKQHLTRGTGRRSLRCHGRFQDASIVSGVVNRCGRVDLPGIAMEAAQGVDAAALEAIVAVSCALSAMGAVSIMFSYLMFEDTRRKQGRRLLFFLSIADLVTAVGCTSRSPHGLRCHAVRSSNQEPARRSPGLLDAATPLLKPIAWRRRPTRCSPSLDAALRSPGVAAVVPPQRRRLLRLQGAVRRGGDGQLGGVPLGTRLRRCTPR